MKDGNRLARVQGVGGEREPAHFMLPAWIKPDDTIVIDFSAPPKGGPKNFEGVFDVDGLKFTKDGNKWPKVEPSREIGFLKFMQFMPNTRANFFAIHEMIAPSFGDDE